MSKKGKTKRQADGQSPPSVNVPPDTGPPPDVPTERADSSPLPTLTISDPAPALEAGPLPIPASSNDLPTVAGAHTVATALAPAIEQPAHALSGLADETHIRYDALDSELQLALEWQQNIAQQQEHILRRIETIRQQARAGRLVFAHGISEAREVLASMAPKPSSGDDEGEIATPPQAPSDKPKLEPVPDDVISYADPAPRDEAKYALFRPRSPGENPDTYKARLGRQGYLLAQEHYTKGAEARKAHAEQIWRTIENPAGRVPDSRPGQSVNPSPNPYPVCPPTQPVRENVQPVGPPAPGPPARETEAANHAPYALSSHASTPEVPEYHRRTNEEPYGLPAAMTLRGPSYLHDSADPSYLLHPELELPNGDYQRKQLAVIQAAIRDRVSYDAPSTQPIKNLKNIPVPEKYGGEDDADAFMSWLKSFLRWLALGRIVGPDLDSDRVQLLGQHLVKEARRWYDDAIDNFNGVGRHWTFEQAVCALYKRFIHRSTARSAAEQFQRLRYRRETGVSGLWDGLITLTRKMPEPPDDYSFKIRFLDALPEELCAPMLRHQNVSIERSSPHELYTAALLQEENNRVLEDWKASHRATHPLREVEKSPRGPDRPDEFYDVEGSQYDPDEELAAAFSSNGADDVWFGSMRVSAREDGDEDVGDHVVADVVVGGSRNELLAYTTYPPNRFVEFIDDLVVQGEPEYISRTEAEWRVRRAARILEMGISDAAPVYAGRSDERAGDSDESDSMPDLEPNVGPTAAHVSHSELARQSWTYMHPPVNYQGPVVELPLDEDLDWAWAHFVDSERSDEDVTRILVVLYRMLHQNNHVLRQLYDARNSADALRSSLVWSRRELAVALFREGEALNGTSPHRLSASDQQRSRIRTQILTETDPLIVDDDTPDEPTRTLSLPEANDLLLRVVEGRNVPSGTGLDPPAYERVCRSTPRFAAMTVSKGTEPLVTRARAGRRPLLSESEQECIVLLLVVNGLGALTLCDAGSTTEMLSNDFAQVSTCDIIQLENPAVLQLGCAGSRSRINFGTRAPVTLGSFGAEVYFDIANLDRYDAVIGTPFLRRFGVILDFKHNCVRIDGQSYPALSRAQVSDVLRKRGAGARHRERPLADSAPPTLTLHSTGP
ncbi:hypothetical protein TRAPUB_7640 [Trametes pubescens]|uniref:Retrotransposon gag domain-containing protein n=1 Tax=Trametes pubescens TaxID=154538 RepID=A0A1M2V2Z2_TRAPU|nr:hypothetical protein TRAPUB_7640 [Trametes pubescens]